MFIETREEQNDNRQDYLFLPFINLTCLNQLTGLNLSYDMITEDFLETENGENVTNTVPNCILEDAFCGLVNWEIYEQPLYVALSFFQLLFYHP